MSEHDMLLRDLRRAMELCATAPHALGGVMIKARVGPVLDAVHTCFAECAQRSDRKVHKLSPSMSEDRLFGGLDLERTLADGRPSARRGFLMEADGGIVLAPMAERMNTVTASALASALDRGSLSFERDGLSIDGDARFGVIAIDESEDEEDGISATLADRLAFQFDLRALSHHDLGPLEQADPPEYGTDFLLHRASAAQIEALVVVASSIGILSQRVPLLAVRVAERSAALNRRGAVNDEDLQFAARCVLAPRALHAPLGLEEEPADPEPQDRPDDLVEHSNESDDGESEELAELILAAARAVLPEALLDAPQGRERSARGTGRAGNHCISEQRGAPLTSRRGALKGGARLDVLATLRAAAPWQKLRRRASGERLQLRPDDFMIKRFQQPSESALVFVVDASGSAAAQRLAEAKGAVELLLSEAHSRRDKVALVTMRGEKAELTIAPTRALTALKRRLSGLPGGGGTPLASGIEMGAAAAADAQRRGMTPTLIFLTDGKANIGRDGTPGRAQARADAMNAAQRVRTSGLTSIIIDTAPRPTPQAEELAREMGSRYAPLPLANPAAVAQAVREAGL